MPPSGLYRQCMHVAHRHNMQAQHIRIINNLNLFLSQHYIPTLARGLLKKPAWGAQAWREGIMLRKRLRVLYEHSYKETLASRSQTYIDTGS